MAYAVPESISLSNCFAALSNNVFQEAQYPTVEDFLEIKITDGSNICKRRPAADFEWPQLPPCKSAQPRRATPAAKGGRKRQELPTHLSPEDHASDTNQSSLDVAGIFRLVSQQAAACRASSGSTPCDETSGGYTVMRWIAEPASVLNRQRH